MDEEEREDQTKMFEENKKCLQKIHKSPQEKRHSKSTFKRITKFDLKWRPYMMHVRNKLLDTDLPRRLNLARWFLQKHNRLVDDIVVGEVAASHLNGRVHNHNIRQYAPKNQPPSFNFEVGISREKVSVWMGLCGNGSIIGPYFYNNNLNSAGYLQIY